MEIPAASIEIRPIQADDLPGILEVYRQCQDFLALGPEPVASLEMVQTDIEVSQQEGGIFCGIFNPEGPIGVLDYSPVNFQGNPQHAFISLLMIAAPHRGRGIGQHIVKRVEAEIKRDKQVTTTFTAVQVNNPPALRFWQRNGYRIVSGSEVQPDSTITYLLMKSV